MSKQRKRGIETRKKIYDFMMAYEDEYHAPPTIRDIAHGAGLSSVGAVNFHIKIMLNDGDICETHTAAVSRKYRTVRE